MAFNPWNSLPKELLENSEFQNNVKSLFALIRLRDALVAPTERIMKNFVAEKIAPGETCTKCTAENIKGTKGVVPRCTICQPRMQCIMGQAVKHGEVKAQINWSNSDPRKWNTHYWEVAKCYLGPGQKDSCGPETTDCTNIITLWLNCGIFTPLCLEKELLEKIRVIRNKLVHSPDMKQSADEMAAVFESIKGLLNDENLRTNPDVDCQAVIAELESVRDKTSAILSELKGDVLDDLMKLEKLKRLRYELADTYRARFSQLQPVPWSDIQLPINMVYQKQTVRGQKDAFKKYDSSLGLRCVFEPSADGGARPQSLLIEGAPGMGKTTLCKRLLEHWAVRAPDIQLRPTQSASQPPFAFPDELDGSRLDEYMLVFFLRVRQLGDFDLAENLLSNLVDASWNKEILDQIICDNIKQVLLVLDGFDEGDDKQKKLAEDWLTGRKHRGCTVMVTSRPGFYQKKPKDTTYSPPDTTYTLEGLSESKQKSFAQRFDDLTDKELGGESTENSAAEQLKPFLHLGFLQYPLLLALVCFLARQGQTVLPQTVTRLYSMFVEFMSHKAMRDPTNFSKEHVSKLTNLNLKIAFDLFGQKKSEMTPDILSKHVSKPEINQTMMDLCKFGLVCQEIQLKGLTNNQTGAFLHQSFLDYFSACHFGSLSREDRSALLDKIAIQENMLMFVAGLYGESECFCQMMEARKRAVKRELNERGDLYDIDHSVLHACLLWVGELQDFTRLRPDHVTDIVQTLEGIELNGKCTASCVRGVTALVHYAAHNHYLLSSHPAQQRPSRLQGTGIIYNRQPDSLSSHTAQQRPNRLQGTSTASSRQPDSLSSHKPHSLKMYNCYNITTSIQLDLLNLVLSSNVNLTCKQLNLPHCLTQDQCERLGAILPSLTHLRDLVIVVPSWASVNYVVSHGFTSTSKLQELIIYYEPSSPHDSSSTAPELLDNLLDKLSCLSKLRCIKLFDHRATLTTENKRVITRRLKARLPRGLLLMIFDKDVQTGDSTLWKDSV